MARMIDTIQMTQMKCPYCEDYTISLPTRMWSENVPNRGGIILNVEIDRQTVQDHIDRFHTPEPEETR